MLGVFGVWFRGPTHISFHLAQLLTGHGCFQNYLWERKRANSPNCIHCEADIDDAEHTIFRCSFWADTRRELSMALRKEVGPEDVEYLLCGIGKDELPDDPIQSRRLAEAAHVHGRLFIDMVEMILSRKEELERQRQRNGV